MQQEIFQCSLTMIMLLSFIFNKKYCFSDLWGGWNKVILWLKELWCVTATKPYFLASYWTIPMWVPIGLILLAQVWTLLPFLNLKRLPDANVCNNSAVKITINSNHTFGLNLFTSLFMQVEGSVVHIMKALSSHPLAAQSLIEDDSLQLLFQMVANGSLTVFTRYKEGLVPLHTIQLHRHAMQVI